MSNFFIRDQKIFIIYNKTVDNEKEHILDYPEVYNYFQPFSFHRLRNL